MRKVIICDKNKELIDFLKANLKEGGQPSGIILEIVLGDVIELHEKTENSRIVTASNPTFSPDGGLDYILSQKYKWGDPKEFTWGEDLFFVKSVGENRNSNLAIVKRALVGVLGYAHKFVPILTGIGTAIGGLPMRDLLEGLVTILSDTDLSDADLSCADLSCANLRAADLSSANLRAADLSCADLSAVVNIDIVYFNEATTFFALSCPENGAFTAWKKCANNTIVKLLIPAKAKRSSATTRKCRASEAKVLDIFDKEGNRIQKTYSNHNNKFVYHVGKTVKPTEPFEEDRWNECGSGIHFFITRREAELYN